MFSLDTLHTNFPTFAPKPTPYIGGKTLTRDPINTGTSVLAVAFKGGVAIAADSLTSYGSMARFNDVPRVVQCNSNTIMSAGGDYADFQYVQDLVQKRVIEDQCVDDGFSMKPRALYNWLIGMLYSRRSDFNPLWNIYIIGGMDGDKPFLGYVDKLGTAFEDVMVATGFGMHIALPMIRKAVQLAEPRGGLTEEEALELLAKCQEVLYYRDARSWPTYHVGIVTKDGARLVGPIKTESNWTVAEMVQGYE